MGKEGAPTVRRSSTMPPRTVDAQGIGAYRRSC